LTQPEADAPTDPALRLELLHLRQTDLELRDQLMAEGRLSGSYIPEMEAVHVTNAKRLRAIVASRGWPGRDLAGEDGAEAAWLIVQHAIGEPSFQRAMLTLLREASAKELIPTWQVGYLEDRIAMLESRPQRYGTQWLDDPEDGRARPWTLADPERVDEHRATLGLEPLAPIPDRGPSLSPEAKRDLGANRAWWLDWLTKKGWTPQGPSTEQG
jgi:hypothetical protein